MTKVTGLGGVFFKSKDPDALRAWYEKHLGLKFDDWGSISFRFEETSPGGRDVCAVWGPFPQDTKYFDPSPSPFMFNFRVDDLEAMLDKLIAEGVEVLPEREADEVCGRFAWILDGEGHKVELWEPPLKQK